MSYILSRLDHASIANVGKPLFGRLTQQAVKDKNQVIYDDEEPDQGQTPTVGRTGPWQCWKALFRFLRVPVAPLSVHRGTRAG